MDHPSGNVTAAVEIGAGWCVGCGRAALFGRHGNSPSAGEAATAGPRCASAGARGLGNGGARRGRGDRPAWQAAFGRKPGTPPARASPLPRSGGVRSRVRVFRGTDGDIGSGMISRTSGGVAARIGSPMPALQIGWHYSCIGKKKPGRAVGNKWFDHDRTIILDTLIRIQAAAMIVVLCYCHDITIGLYAYAGTESNIRLGPLLGRAYR
jgi:hypothetical protein